MYPLDINVIREDEERMKKRWLLLWFVCVLVSPNVKAQTLPAVKNDSTHIGLQNHEFHYKSPQKAFLLSFGNTVIPIVAGTIILRQTTINDSKNLRIGGGAMIIYGAIVGPSIGTFYAGSFGRGFGGILLRAGSATLGTAGLAIAFVQAWDNYDGNDQGSIAPAIMFFSGAILLVSSAVVQIAKAPEVARKHNKSIHLAFSPTWYPKVKTPGLAINIRF